MPMSYGKPPNMAAGELQEKSKEDMLINYWDARVEANSPVFDTPMKNSKK